MRYLIVLLSCLLLNGCGSLWQWVMTDEEKASLRRAAKDAAACQVSLAAQTPMRFRPLYSWQQGSCESVPVRNEVKLGDERVTVDMALYADHFCRQPVNYRLTRYYQFCADYNREGRLGNAADLDNGPAPWTLDPSTRMALPVEYLLFNHQPYMQRHRYLTRYVADERSVAPNMSLRVRRGSGECHLEMRVFKKDPLANNLKPLLLLPAGGLESRGFHSLAMQSQISLYTDEGFVVYLPFFRTLGNGDGPLECQQATWQQIHNDALAALHWIKHQQETDQPVAILAAGGGALLAAFLLTEQSALIGRGLLLYPYLDSRQLLADIQQGRYQQRQGIRMLQQLLDIESLEQLELDDPRLKATSLARALMEHGDKVRIIHGVKDQRIPVSQTELFCRQLPQGQCQPDQAILIDEAGYQLDYCLLGVDCPAGNAQSRWQIRRALQQARDWLKGDEA